MRRARDVVGFFLLRTDHLLWTKEICFFRRSVLLPFGLETFSISNIFQNLSEFSFDTLPALVAARRHRACQSKAIHSLFMTHSVILYIDFHVRLWFYGRWFCRARTLIAVVYGLVELNSSHFSRLINLKLEMRLSPTHHTIRRSRREGGICANGEALVFGSNWRIIFIRCRWLWVSWPLSDPYYVLCYSLQPARMLLFANANNRRNIAIEPSEKRNAHEKHKTENNDWNLLRLAKCI